MASSGAVWTLDSHTAWCVKSVVFTMGTGNGQMKLYLVNSAFEVSPYGWLEVIEPDGFGGQPTYTADLNSIALPNGYDNIPPGTQIQFKINCTSGPCSGSVKITYGPVAIP
jgi:hypothetical protein